MIAVESVTETQTKTCSKCGREQSVGNFSRNKRNKDGRQWWCKRCHGAQDAVYGRSGAAITKQLERTYGITLGDYYRMYAEQSGCCAICGVHHKARGFQEPGRGGARCLVVDHNHSTNAVRRLLCNNCNLLVGLVEKNRPKLLTVLRYIRANGKETSMYDDD